MENFKFILVCLAIFAGLFLLALWFEKLLVKERKKLSDTHYITYTALLSAMAGVLMLLEIPLFFAPSFYKLDLSELPVLICTFYLGPVAGVVSELLKVIIKLILKGTSTAFVGDFANFAVGCSFVLPASILYHSRPSRRRAIMGLALGTLVMTVFGSALLRVVHDVRHQDHEEAADDEKEDHAHVPEHGRAHAGDGVLLHMGDDKKKERKAHK